MLTYTYTKNLQGQFVWFCDSIGFPISGGTQFSAPESMQHYRVRDLRYSAETAEGWFQGVEKLPQAEPNGIFPPSTAAGSRVICINPRTNVPSLSHAEDNLDTFEYPRSNAIDEPNRSGDKPKPKDPLIAK